MAIRAIVIRYKPGLKGLEEFKETLRAEISNALFRSKIAKVLKHDSVYRKIFNEDEEVNTYEYLGDVIILKGPWVVLKSIDVIWGKTSITEEFKERYEHMMKEPL